jgi:hypothetical protein
MANTEKTKHLDEFPYAEVWLRKHVFQGGYTLMGVEKGPEGFRGSFGFGLSPVSEEASSFAECCRKLDQRFRECMPDHECGSDCFGWQPVNSVMGDPPPGKTQ